MPEITKNKYQSRCPDSVIILIAKVPKTKRCALRGVTSLKLPSAPNQTGATTRGAFTWQSGFYVAQATKTFINQTFL